jgi:hypothetical protein
MTKPYRVFVVVDREYGQRLTALTQEGPVWAVDTPANRAVAQHIWDAEPNRSHLQGITIFKFPKDGSPEDILVNELDTIDLHHGTYSANPPYTELDVIGTAITPRLRTELGQFGSMTFKKHHMDSVQYVQCLRMMRLRRTATAALLRPSR